MIHRFCQLRSSLKREHPALQHLQFLYFCGSFLPFWIRIRSGSMRIRTPNTDRMGFCNMFIVQLQYLTRAAINTSVVDPDPHHFGNLFPQPDPYPNQIKIRIRIRIHIKVINCMRINLQITSQNVRMEYEPILALFFKGLSLYLEGRNWIRIRIRIRVKSRIRIRIK